MMISPPGLLSRQENLSRGSVLTFAAIYYPDTGMQSFEGDSLEALTDYELADESSVSHDDFIARRNLGRKDQRTRPANPEPFAVLGGRQRHFIGICSSKVYERYLKGLVPFRKCESETTSESSYSTTESDVDDYATIPIGSILLSDFDVSFASLCFQQVASHLDCQGAHAEFYPLDHDDAPQHPVSVPITPSANSMFTFAPLGDAKQRIPVYHDGKHLYATPFFKEDDAITDTFATPREDLEEIQDSQIIYLPATRTPNTFRDAIPSSTLNGLKGRWNGLPYYGEDEGFYDTVEAKEPCKNLVSNVLSISLVSVNH